jgi:CDP-6-deoxy-D-xylo-4-hexulose-3-dehydrase
MNESDALREQISSLVQSYAELTLKNVDFRPGESRVPVSGKVIGFEELDNMVAASLDGWLTTGRFNEQFERELADFIGVRHLITVTPGHPPI